MKQPKQWYARIPWRWRDLAEKVLSTWFQSFLIVLLGSSWFTEPDTAVLVSAGIAALPALITMLLNVVNGWTIDAALPPAIQALHRVIRTATATGLGYLVAVPVFSLDVSLWKSALFAAFAALLAALKAEAARHVGASLPTFTAPSPQDVVEAAARALPRGSEPRKVVVTYADNTMKVLGSAPTPNRRV